MVRYNYFTTENYVYEGSKFQRPRNLYQVTKVVSDKFYCNILI